MKHSISIEDLTFGYLKDRPIFKDLGFEIKHPGGSGGRVVALMGASGSGKSTLLKLLLKIEEPAKGQIRFGGDPVLAYVPQEPVLFEHLTALDNARYFSSAKAFRDRFDQELFAELARSLQLDEVLNGSGSVLALSGGQKQRISLLRAMSIRPDILLLDEPTTGLDAEVKLLFLSKVRAIADRFGLLVIYVTHHKLEAELLADEVVFLSKDPQTQTISQIVRGELVEFIDAPPLLDAVKVFRYPQPNLLTCRIAEGQLQLADQEKDAFTINVMPGQAVFSAHAGFAIEQRTENALYTNLKLKGTPALLTFPRTQIKPGNYLQLTGEFITYDLSGFAGSKITIQENMLNL